MGRHAHGARHRVLLGLKRKNVNSDKSSLEIRWSQRRFSESYLCETGTSMKAVEFARIRKDCWRKIAVLTMSARVKHFSSALLHALKAERHFALLEDVVFPTVGALVIVFQVRNSVRPMHLFGHNRDHDYYFELPREGERDPQSHVQKKAAWIPGRDTMWAYNTRQDPALAWSKRLNPLLCDKVGIALRVSHPDESSLGFIQIRSSGL